MVATKKTTKVLYNRATGKPETGKQPRPKKATVRGAAKRKVKPPTKLDIVGEKGRKGLDSLYIDPNTNKIRSMEVKVPVTVQRGVRALLEIRKSQGETQLCLPKAPFAR